MAILEKNKCYTLRHIDIDTGYGVLYSEEVNQCILLNPLATALWRAVTDYLDPSQACYLFNKTSEIPNAADYLEDVIKDMSQKGLFLVENDNNSAYPENFKKGSYKDYPLEQVYFYSTRECNARCYHCYQPTVKVAGISEEHPTKTIGARLFLKFIEKAIPLGLRHVKITGGEPFLRADLSDIIKGLRKMGVDISIETNGFFLNEKNINMLAEHHVDVSISLDGGSAAVHDSLRGLPGSFERVIQAVRMLADRGCKPKTIMALSHRNLDEVENVLNVAAANGCYLVKLNPVSSMGLANRLKKSDVLLTVDEILELYQRREELESKYGVFVFLEGPPSFSSIYDVLSGHTGICPFTRILGVLADGSLSFCGVGNSCQELVFQKKIDDKDFDITEFWQAAKPLIQARNTLSKSLEGVCGQCILESFCQGSCRALAYTEYKSFSAPHPWCQQAFEKGIFPSYYLNDLNGFDSSNQNILKLSQ